MHQIYSCSDENIEVFTTVIPSKVPSPSRRRVKSSQHLLAKNVVIESDLYPPRPLELLPQRCERRDTGDRRWLQTGRDTGDRRWLQTGRPQTARPPGVHPTKTTARPVGISEPRASTLCGNRAYGKSLIPPVARISVKAPVGAEVAAKGSEKGAVLGRGSRHLKKIAEEYPALPQGAEASLPLTGTTSCGVPGILRKMWTRHKKKAEYMGATNSAFEAD